MGQRQLLLLHEDEEELLLYLGGNNARAAAARGCVTPVLVLREALRRLRGRQTPWTTASRKLMEQGHRTISCQNN